LLSLPDGRGKRDVGASLARETRAPETGARRGSPRGRAPRNSSPGRTAMTYKLVQLAEGAYDVQRSGEVIASLVVATATRGSDRWCAELLDETSPYPSPFTAA